MQILLSICLLVSAFFVIRSLNGVIRQWYVYEYNKDVVIERINEKQQKVDILVGVYLAITTLFWAYVMLLLIDTLFDVQISDNIYATNAIVIICLYLCYHVLCYVFERKYGISAFYYDMIEYRKMQKVVTLDNDFEVSYIKACENYFKHRRVVILLVISLVLYVLFV